MTEKEMRVAVNSYLETLLWTETLSVVDAEGEPGVLTYKGTQYQDGCPLQDLVDASDVNDINPKIIEELETDLNEFAADCMHEVGLDPFRFFDPEEVARNFCLSRNGHGAGFFDRRWIIESWVDNRDSSRNDLSRALQSCAKAQGTHGLIVWVEVQEDQDGAQEEVLRLESHS